MGRTQKFNNIQSLTCAQNTSVILIAGARLIAVRGANSDASTYSFKVSVSAIGASQFGNCGMTYTGMPNGTRVNLWRDWPHISSKGTPGASAAGDISISVTAGQYDSLEVYYSTGDPLIDLTPKVLSGSQKSGDEEVPLAVRQWLSNK